MSDYVDDDKKPWTVEASGHMLKQMAEASPEEREALEWAIAEFQRMIETHGMEAVMAMSEPATEEELEVLAALGPDMEEIQA